MTGKPLNHRSIVEDKHFEAQRKKLRISCKRLDELMEEGVAFALSRNPEKFPLVPGSEIRRIRVHGCIGIPSCNIWFSYDDNEIHLIEIDVIEE